MGSKKTISYYRRMNTQAVQPDPTTVAEAHRHCEKIAAREVPNLYLAARFFDQAPVFDAFCSSYASMRIIDDRIDSLADRESLSKEEKERVLGSVQNWLDNLNAAFSLKPPDDPIWIALADTFSKFDLPTDPWEDLATAMAMDIEMPYFKDWRTLQKYMRGASVAPAIVFMHLVLTKMEDDEYICQWSYDEVVAATEDLAMFCYWTHILRDVSQDLDIGENGLVYLPLSELNQFGLTPDDLRRMKRNKTATFAYKSMAEHLYRRARVHEQKGRQFLTDISAVATDPAAFGLAYLVDIYSATLTKVESVDFDIFMEDAELTVEEKREVLLQTAEALQIDQASATGIFDAVFAEA